MRQLLMMVAVSALAAAGSAGAACKINSPAALICTVPRNAALAFQRFKRDPHALDADYVRETVRAAGCTRLSDYAEFRDQPILLGVVKGRVATNGGWVNVVEIIVKNPKYAEVNGFYGIDQFIAADYLSGSCDLDYDPEEVRRLNQ